MPQENNRYKTIDELDEKNWKKSSRHEENKYREDVEQIDTRNKVCTSNRIFEERKIWLIEIYREKY